MGDSALRQEQIYVSSEWGSLKECVYGWPDQFILPKYLADAKARAYGEKVEYWIENQEKHLAEADPELFGRLKAQVEGAVAMLERLGVTVRQPTYVSEANLRFPRGENHGCVTPWLRDPFVTIGNNVIELAPRSLFHRRQRFSVRHILAETMERGARYFAQPDGGADDSAEGPGWGYLEGGDIFVLGRQILVGHSGNCSNLEGVRWLQHALGSDYQVDAVTLDPLFPHLDCVLMTPREGLAVAAVEAFPEGLPTPIKDWELIEIDIETAKRDMGCNNLVLDDRTVMIPSEAPHDRLAGALEARGFEVIRLPYEAPCGFGGSFRCAHQPLIRI